METAAKVTPKIKAPSVACSSTSPMRDIVTRGLLSWRSRGGSPYVPSSKKAFLLIGLAGTIE
jgi:hypothetical protein